MINKGRTHCTVAFRGGVKLHAFHVESLIEFAPHVCTQAIAYRLAYLVLLVEWRHRLIHQKAANLAHIHETRAIKLNALFPEVGRAELFTQNHSAAGDKRRAYAYDSSYCMIYGQSNVDDVATIQVSRVVKREATR